MTLTEKEDTSGVVVTTEFLPDHGLYDDIREKKVDVVVTETEGLMIHSYEHIIERIKSSGDMDDLLSEDADFVIEKLQSMDPAEALEVLAAAIDYHSNDINFPAATMAKIQRLVQGVEAYDEGEVVYDLDIRLEASMIKYYSPYPEVRSVVGPLDDPTIPVETFRVYLVAMVWVVIGAFVNQIMTYRRPSISLSSQVIQILIFPCGRFMQYVLPKKKIGFGRYKVDLNPGPWSFKEQVFCSIIVNCAATASIFNSYMPTMRLEMFYNQSWMNYSYSVLMGLAVQFFGFGMSGCLRRWAIYPTKAVWPTVLPVLQLNRTLLIPETKRNINGWTISKYRLFYILLLCSLVYLFLPDFLFKALSTFNWMTWIAPNNKNLAYVTGSLIGVGFNPIPTFDWSVVNYSRPLVVPFFSTANPFFGSVLGGLIVLICYYTNYKYSAYLPPNTSTVYDRFGNSYNTSRILTVDQQFNVTAYRDYSPPYISAGQNMYQATAYTIYTFAFVYVFASEWHTMVEALKGFYHGLRYRTGSNYDRYSDPMSTHMRNYKEVPDWWYLALLIASIGVGIAAVGAPAFPTQTPVYVVVVAVVVAVGLLIPFIVLYSTTGYFMSINNLGTILGGYLQPGNGLACIYTRTFAFGVDEQSELVVGDLKMAHYAKIPPRAVFRGQFIGTLIMIFVTSGVVEILVGMEDFCSFQNKSKFVCTFAHTLYADSLLMGVIGPARTFGELYPMFKWAFLIGACMAPPVFLIRKRFLRYLRFFHPVLFMGGLLRYGSTYNLSYYLPGFYASTAFMWYAKTRYLAWWSKYNYIISSGMAAGVAFGSILIFLALQLHPVKLEWWGNTVQDAGIDGDGSVPLMDLPEQGWFGLPPGSWQ
ncbi:OPT oligopeptide transporter protein-domain-containing protein [Myxozyma melibiosi]|uniref:OPT oligopeptide transporter protein-domain-containing protein n=1 Tax=Myxozyma melibiosi TaxID=54550 RepID=A0ABR1EZ40_9ASCO